MKKGLTIVSTLVALTVFNSFRAMPGLAKITPPRAQCFCKAIEYVGENAGDSIDNPLLDLGILAEWDSAVTHVGACRLLCKQKADDNDDFNNPTLLCEKIRIAGEHRVAAYSKVGGMDWKYAEQDIRVNCTGGIETCTCPAGWTSNTTQQDGGVTTDHKCKKLACLGNAVPPYPENGTPIGSWGFTWENAFVAWGTQANGGAPSCVTTPWEGQKRAGRSGPSRR